MNVLERLRSDMDDAGRAACACAEDETDACLEILDEFSAGQEVVEVGFCDNREEAPDGYGRWSTVVENYGARTTILVPRTEPPSLLAAAEAAVAWLQEDVSIDGLVNLKDRLEALAQAIKKERGR